MEAASCPEAGGADLVREKADSCWNWRQTSGRKLVTVESPEKSRSRVETQRKPERSGDFIKIFFATHPKTSHQGHGVVLSSHRPRTNRFLTGAARNDRRSSPVDLLSRAAQRFDQFFVSHEDTRSRKKLVDASLFVPS